MARKPIAAPPLSGVLERLRALRGDLPPTARRIADFLIDHIEATVASAKVA